MAKVKLKSFVLDINLRINKSLPAMNNNVFYSSHKDLVINGKLKTKANDFKGAAKNATARAKKYMQNHNYKHGKINVADENNFKSEIINL